MAIDSLISDRFTLRKFQAEDFADLYALFLKTHDAPWSEQTLNNTLNQDDCFVVFEGEQFVGFCIFNCIFDTAEIHYIAVANKYRGQNIGMSLIAAVEHDVILKGANRLLLEVAKDNQSAICLYQKAGFEQIDTRKAYYQRLNGDAVDALILQKLLQQD